MLTGALIHIRRHKRKVNQVQIDILEAVVGIEGDVRLEFLIVAKDDSLEREVVVYVSCIVNNFKDVEKLAPKLIDAE